MGLASAAGRSAGKAAGKYLAPRIPSLAPDLTASFVHEALHRALHGVGPMSPAAAAADKASLNQQRLNHRRRAPRDRDQRAVEALIDDHVRYAGAQGLLTSVGGALTAVVSIPANIAGLALIQLRMVAAIAHLRGYDLEDAKVHNALLACLLGEERVEELVRTAAIPAPPMALATAPVLDPGLSRVLAAEVTSELITRSAGRHAAVAIGRRVPLVGGVFGMGVDGVATWRIGGYSAGELRPRARR